MIHLYREGSSLVHRIPAGVKLTILAVAALALSLYPHDAWSVAVTLLLVLCAYAVAALPPRVPARELWRLRWLILVLAAALALFVDPLTAWINTARLAALVLMAGLLTITTRLGDLQSVLRRMLAPLRRVGADPEVVALTVSLTITMIPVVAGFAEQVREAHDARGVRLGVGSVVPLLVRTLRHADIVGDALAARGIG